MNRTLIVDTGHDIFHITNLKRIWISKKAFIYKLMFEDEKQIKCIFWSIDRYFVEESKQKIVLSYKHNDHIVYL